MKTKTYLAFFCFVSFSLSLLFSLILVNASSQLEVKIDVPVRGTFLRAEAFTKGKPTGGSDVEKPAIIDLESYGFFELDWIVLSYEGEFYPTEHWDPNFNMEPNATHTEEWFGLIAVFSETDELLEIYDERRVSRAIDNGTEHYTGLTYFENKTTDIIQDFKITPPSGITVLIPENAKFLFVCVDDNYYPDNEGWIELTIRSGQAPFIFSMEALSALVVMVVVIIVIFVLYRRKKTKPDQTINTRNARELDAETGFQE
jgi:hypothetical protein